MRLSTFVTSFSQEFYTVYLDEFVIAKAENVGETCELYLATGESTIFPDQELLQSSEAKPGQMWYTLINSNGDSFDLSVLGSKIMTEADWFKLPNK